MTHLATCAQTGEPDGDALLREEGCALRDVDRAYKARGK